MPTYEYRCLACSANFDIIKPISRFDDVEACPDCGKTETKHQISRTHFYGASDWDKAEYNPGLGIVTKGKKHRDREAKARGLIEVGNESLETVSKQQGQRLAENTAALERPALEKLEYGLKKEMGKI